MAHRLRTTWTILGTLLLATGPSRASDEEDDASRDGTVDQAVVSLGRHGRFACSGVVVGPRAVLTAAHCLPLDEVRVGSSWSAAESGDSFHVKHAHPHPDRRVDAAVLHLAKELSVSAVHRLTSARTPPTAPWRVVGFGALPPHPGGERLGYTLPPQDVSCNGWRVAVTGCLTGTEWVVAGQQGFDTCQGDSGGALITQQPDGPALAAIVSRGVQNSRRPCGGGGVYVRLDALEPWLRPLLATESP